MKMRRIDHVVLPVANLDAARRFYHEVFDMPVLDQQTTDDVVTLRCGHQLIRLEKVDRKGALVASKLIPGTADLCLVAGDDMDAIVHHLRSYFVDVVAGPLEKNGTEGKMTSVYLRDPDQNLIEIAVYENK